MKTTAMPANGILAATFNRDVAYRAGNIIGNDGIWSGCAGLYGIGANIHRSPYLGRTVEYYSECGTLTGLIAAAESKGIEFNTHGLEDAFTMWRDADKVTKITMNLLSIALKFTPTGGKVSLSFEVLPREEAARDFPGRFFL